MNKPRHKTLRPAHRLLVWCAAVGALTGVFAMYARPEFMVAMANQVWGCF